MAATSRSCGACSLCCKAMSVSAIPKGRGVWCYNASRAGEGCLAYSDRPAACRDWSCAWLLGYPLLGEKDKPDRTGVVVSLDGPRQVSLHESEPGLLGRPAVIALKDRLVAAGETVTSLPLSARASVEGPLAEEIRRRQARAEKRSRR